MPSNEQPLSIKLNQWSILAIQGQDAKPFLQGQVTVDMDDVNSSQAKLSGYCNLKGRLHGMFYVLPAPHDDGYWLVMPEDIVGHVHQTLKKYAMFSKVKLVILDSINIIGLINSADERFAITSSTPFTCHSIEDSGMSVALPMQRCLVLIPHDQKSELTQYIADLPQGTDATWDEMDIKCGFPWIQAQTIEQFLPHYLNLDKLGCLNFKKGCYLGQEIIARMEYKGNIKRHLYLAHCDSNVTIPPNTEVLSSTDSIGGHVLYSAVSNHGAYCLISLQDALIDDELKLNFENISIIRIQESTKGFS